MKKMTRREFVTAATATMPAVLAGRVFGAATLSARGPNIVFVFADQWRGQATGYAGDPNLQGKTPNLDRLAGESINLNNAVSTTPVCTPYRASLLTGQYPLTHGLFLNDAPLNPEAVTMGKIYKAAGYDTGYVGKWHIDGHGRSSYIPKERRQGFEYWKVLECTHNYNKSAYYEGEDKTKKYWPGYDAIEQTKDVQQFIKDHAGNDKPFLMVLSWGGPHNPYQTAPDKYKKMFNACRLKLRENVLDQGKVRKDLAGYYAHIAALDDCMGRLMKTLDETGIRDNTILVFTSDHGDMLGSQGEKRKQKPYDESVSVPFLVRYPKLLGSSGKKIDMPIGSPDILPTLLGMSGISIPGSIEGDDYSRVLSGQREPDNDAAMIECQSPFGEWRNGREYRGIRTRRYTYVRDLNGPWLLFDNKNDPFQKINLVDNPEAAGLLKDLDSKLDAKLAAKNDAFLPGKEYIAKWGYKTKNGTIPYQK